MSTDPFQPDLSSLGLTEADVAAWVECELPRDRHESVGLAIETNPALAKRLRAMRADREAVRAMPEVHAPEGLLDAVEATMERQALLGLSDGVELTNAPPVSVIRTTRRPLSETFSLRTAPTRLAAAAAILLMVGSAAYVGIWQLSKPTAPTNPIATLGSPDANTNTSTDTVPDPDTVLAAATPKQPNPQPPYANSMRLAFSQSTFADNPALQGLPADPIAMGTSEALQLAAQGRLIIHVSSPDAGAALRNLGSLAVRSAGAADQWRLTSDVPDDIVATLSPGEPTIEPFSIANDKKFEQPVLNIDRPTLTGVYMADARLTPESIESLLEALAADGRTATFTASDEPIDLGTRPVRLDEVVWWTASPTDWAMWTRVPVVFEPQR
jgi:hypothetical protein